MTLSQLRKWYHHLSPFIVGEALSYPPLYLNSSWVWHKYELKTTPAPHTGLWSIGMWHLNHTYGKSKNGLKVTMFDGNILDYQLTVSNIFGT